MDHLPKKTFVGRGSSITPPNRFESLTRTDEGCQLDDQDLGQQLSQKISTEYFFDDSASIVGENQSPDIDFNFSLNPYRGCAHGCSYCYARPTHEYLGWNAGIDFESKVLVKKDAPLLFRNWLARPRWSQQLEPVMMSGVTDCYQPCEKEFSVSRQCLQVAQEFGQPMRVITKNSLILRDLDILSEMACRQLVSVAISLSSLDQSLIRIMEPRSSSPQARLDTIAALAQHNVPVRVMVAPIIPAINDHELPKLLRQAAAAGASSASFTLLRLPGSVEPVFLDWLQRNFPDKYNKVLQALREMRGGKLNSPSFQARMKGEGVVANQLSQLFHVVSKQAGLDQKLTPLRTDLFQPPPSPGEQQLTLF